MLTIHSSSRAEQKMYQQNDNNNGFEEQRSRGKMPCKGGQMWPAVMKQARERARSEWARRMIVSFNPPPQSLETGRRW